MIFDQISATPLRDGLMALAERAGEESAIAQLQALLRVEPTGMLDGVTLSTLWKHDPQLLADALAPRVP